MYGKEPGPVSSYAYDGVSVIIDAIRKAGPDRDKIQKALMEISFEGVTGEIQFDSKGNRKTTPGLIEIKNSLPVAVGR
jgi:branched-chain amino acid transport system substrate-binding protein